MLSIQAKNKKAGGILSSLFPGADLLFSLNG
jgi:hypothetical protein